MIQVLPPDWREGAMQASFNDVSAVIQLPENVKAIRLLATQDVFIRTESITVTSANGILLPANQAEWFFRNTRRLSAIRSTTSGVLYIAYYYTNI